MKPVKRLALLFALLLMWATPLTSAHAQFGGEEGTPILILDGHTTTPSPVRSGEEFTLTVTVRNIGAKHADKAVVSVSPGGQFVQVGPPAQIEKLEPDPQLNAATVSLRVRASALSAGAYNLGLSLSYRIGTSGEYNTARTVGVNVAGQGEGVTGGPQVIVESLTPLATPGVGGVFEARVVFRNVGARTAFAVSSTLRLNDYLSPASGSGSAQLGDLAAGQAVTQTLSLVLNKAHPSGRLQQTFSLEYRDASNTRLTAEETASLDLGSAGQATPQVIVSGYRTEPAQPAPGEAFTLHLQLTNVGAGTARRVLARLGDDSDLKPFVPLASGNVLAAPDLAPGQTVTVTQTLLMEGAAAGGAYALKVGLSYENVLGEARTESAVIGLLALYRPQLQIGLSKPISGTLSAGRTFDLPVEVINLGRQRVEVSVVEIVSEDLALTRNSLYVGPLDPSISGALTAKATAQKNGTATATVVVHYRDELNRMQTLEHTLSFEIQPASAFTPTEAPPNTDAPPSLWQAILGLFGLGG